MDIQLEWRDIIGYNGQYQVSDTGLVRSNKRASCLGKVLRMTTQHQGYKVVTLCAEGVPKTIKVHCLVAEAFIGPRPDGLDVCHRDDNKSNNNMRNLRYDTRSNNCMDSVRNGTHWSVRNPRTECREGHPLSDDNVYLRPNGSRICKVCHKKRQKTYQEGLSSGD